jgi:hypothetical protein
MPITIQQPLTEDEKDKILALAGRIREERKKGKIKDETGNVYGRLRVISSQGLNEDRKAMWLCSCECGKQVVVAGVHMRRGSTKSCGCLHIETATYMGRRNSKSKLRYLEDDFGEDV